MNKWNAGGDDGLDAASELAQIDALDPENFGKAEKLYKRIYQSALRKVGPEDPQFVSVLLGMGTFYVEHRKCQQASPILNRALSVFEKTNKERPLELSSIFQSLATCYEAIGAYADALKFLEMAKKQLVDRFGQSSVFVAYIMHQVAGIHLAQGNLDAAYDTSKKVVQFYVDRVSSGIGLAGTGEQSVASIRHVFDRYVTIAWALKEARGDTVDPYTEDAFLASQWANQSRAGIALLQMSVRFFAQEGKMSNAMRKKQDLVLTWNQLEQRLIAAMGRPVQDRTIEKLASLQAEIADVENEIAAVTEELRSDCPRCTALLGSMASSIAAVRSQSDNKRKSSKNDNILSNGAETVGKTKQIGNLRDKEILVLFNVHDQNTYVWAITPRYARWKKLDLKSADLDLAIQSLRCGLSAEEWYGALRADRCARALGLPQVPEDGAPLPFDLNIAHELYKDLFGEFEDLIEGKHLLIVPSGALTSLPFQVLVTENPKTGMPKDYAGYRDVAWLGARQPILVLPSVSSLVALRENTKISSAPRKYLGFGDPILEGNSGCISSQFLSDCGTVGGTSRSRRGSRSTREASLDLTFSGGASGDAVLSAVRRLCPLPDTKLELECIARNLGVDDSELRLGAAATEAEIKGRKDLDQYRVLHFATHGIVAGDIEKMARRQGEPALVMTPPETPAADGDDGLLMASEITRLKLDADWVILSACNTASGDKLGAEALSGLARAFFYAGARSLLVSHWPVYSDAAVSLTTTAFDRMREAERAQKPISRAEAMRRAMVTMMKSNSYPDNPHPAVWAPFSIVGEGGMVRSQTARH